MPDTETENKTSSISSPATRGDVEQLLSEIKHSKSSGRSTRISLTGYKIALVLLIVVAVLSVCVTALLQRDSFNGNSTGHASLVSHGISYTSADFENAVLLEARETALLVVYEQDVSVDTTLKKTFADLPVFTKTKTMRSFGVGIYAIDLSVLTSASVKLNALSSLVTISIPRPTLYKVTPDFTKTQFEDTDRGLLAFGEIKLTAEQKNELQLDIIEEMTNLLSTKTNVDKAERAALSKSRELFGPLVRGVAQNCSVAVLFDD
ncbi:MAG: DUF4230 domain-containing protein [Oscillospiraceae bacterium]